VKNKRGADGRTQVLGVGGDGQRHLGGDVVKTTW
jgi:hypothetical protein